MQGTIDSNKTISSIAQKYCDEIKNAPFYNTFCKNIQEVVALNEIELSSFQNSFNKIIKEAGLENQLKNDVYYWMKERNYFHKGVGCWTEKEPMEYLQDAQLQWEKRIYKSINSLCSKLGVSLSTFRLASERDEFMEKWTMLSTYSIDLSEYRPVYAPKDFLDVLLSIKAPNHEMLQFCDKWDFGFISLTISSLRDLKRKYQRLMTKSPLLGTFEATSQMYSVVEEERLTLGEAVLKENKAPATQDYLKCLAPHSLRGKLWAQVLGSEIFPWHKEYFKNLKKLVGQYDMLVDKLIFKDIQLTVCNDDQYFVYEDLLYQVILSFTRDTAVAHVLRFNSSNPMIGVLKGKSSTISSAVIYPPNAVIPFYGFSMFAAPLGYIFSDPVQLYFSFRSLYIRYWFRLHEVNSHQQGILSLCILFQRLLDFNEPQLSHHFTSIGVQPIRVVFKWLMKCFSGYLPPEQLLYLWDLIIGYDSLEIVPLLAVSILNFRKYSLLQVDTMQNVEAVLADLSSIQVIPLLQLVINS